MFDISPDAIRDLQNRWEALAPTLVTFDALPMDAETARLILIGRQSFTDPRFVNAMPMPTADMKPRLVRWLTDFAQTQDQAYEFDVDEAGKLIPPPGLREGTAPLSWQELHQEILPAIDDMKAMNEVKFGALSCITLNGQIGTFWEPRVPHHLHIDGRGGTGAARCHLRETCRLGALPFVFLTEQKGWRERLTTDADLQRHTVTELWQKGALETADLNRSYAFLPRSFNATGQAVGTPHGSSPVERKTPSVFLRWQMEWPLCRMP